MPKIDNGDETFEIPTAIDMNTERHFLHISSSTSKPNTGKNEQIFSSYSINILKGSCFTEGIRFHDMKK